MREKRFLVEAELRDLSFPIQVISRAYPEGQPTIANVSMAARIMSQFQVQWFDRFIQALHRHRRQMGAEALMVDMVDYQKILNANRVRLTLEYPFFIEQKTPVSKEACLVRYSCSYSAEISSVDKEPKITFSMKIPIVTTYSGSTPDQPGGLFGQSTVVDISIQSRVNVFPEDLVEIANRHALSPVYSFLTEEDQAYVIQQVHGDTKTSLALTDEIREELARNQDITWFSVRCANYGILYPYSTVIGTEKSIWVPQSGYDEEI